MFPVDFLTDSRTKSSLSDPMTSCYAQGEFWRPEDAGFREALKDT